MRNAERVPPPPSPPSSYLLEQHVLFALKHRAEISSEDVPESSWAYVGCKRNSHRRRGTRNICAHLELRRSNSSYSLCSLKSISSSLLRVSSNRMKRGGEIERGKTISKDFLNRLDLFVAFNAFFVEGLRRDW